MCLHCILEGEKFWFTSLEHHKRGTTGGGKGWREEEEVVEEEEEEEEEYQTPFQGCEVILSLVESSVLVDRPFFNSHKQQGR